MRYELLTMSEERHVSLCGTNVYPQPEYHPDRVMTDHDLLYIHEGEWVIAQDDEVFHLHAGDLIFLRAGSHHFSPSPCSANARTIFIHINRLPSDRSIFDISPSTASHYATGIEICLPTVLHCPEGSGIPALLKNIIDIFWSRRDDQKRTLALLIHLLLNELSYTSRKAYPPPLPKIDNWLMRLIQKFHAETSHFYTLEEAAELVHIHVRTLSDRFRKATGKSIHQYQIDLKLDMAFQALATGQFSVKQVAEDYGFCDPYYFSRVFKKRYHIAPSEIKHGHPEVNIHRPWMNESGSHK